MTTKTDRLQIRLKTDRLQIRIDPELKAKLQAAADKDNRSLGNYILNILKQHIDKQGK